MNYKSEERTRVEKKQCDVFVIGAGAAGTLVARKCKDAGLDVVIAEKNGWGGVCPLRGCEPKKTLVDAVHTATRARDMKKMGVSGDVGVDWASLMRFKRSFVDPISDAVLSSLEKAELTTIQGQAHINADGTVEVPGHGVYEADNVMLAVGAKPRRLDVPGDDLLQTSTDFLDLDAMPDSVAFIGGGFISFEFAAIAAAVGADVTIVHRSDRVLKGFDKDLVQTLIKAMEAMGVKIILNQEIVSVDRHGDGVALKTKDKNGGEQTMAFDAGFLGAGRIPQLSGLGLEQAGVETSGDGVVVNEFMQSVSNLKFFAAGDCADTGLPLTPVAALQGEVVAENIINGPSAKSDLRGTASIVFTHPPLSRVGLSEDEAKERGIDYTLHFGDAAKWSEHKRIGLEHAGYKVLEEKLTGRILGAHYLGQHAEEVANVFGMAIRHGLTRRDLLAQPWSYPSFSYALRYMLG